jgi:hypothetical protein
MMTDKWINILMRQFRAAVLGFFLLAGHEARAFYVNFYAGQAYPGGAVVAADGVTGLPTSGGGIGYAFGVSMGAKMSKGLALEYGLFYGPRGFSFVQNSQNYSYSTTAVQFPLMLRIPMLRFVFFGVGPYFAYSLGSLELSPAYGSGAQISAVDYGLVGSLGIMIPLAVGMSVVGDARYVNGIKNVSLNSSFIAGFTEVQGFVGLRFGRW